jgi:hypothetical protein
MELYNNLGVVVAASLTFGADRMEAQPLVFREVNDSYRLFQGTEVTVNGVGTHLRHAACCPPLEINDFES